MRSIVLRWAFAAIVGGHLPVASAALWGYIDEAGVAHFATDKLDDRYQLFFKGRTSLDADRDDDSAGRRARAALEGSPLYRRVADHPNVRRYAALIERNALASALDPALVKAVIAVESAFDPNAVSAKGAIGLMQIIPATAVRYGLIERHGRTIAQQLLDPPTNVRIGVRYLRDLLDIFGSDLSLALAAYNAGEESVRQSGNRIPPFRETREYVTLVQQFKPLYEPPAIPPSRSTRVDLSVRHAKSVGFPTP